MRLSGVAEAFSETRRKLRGCRRYLYSLSKSVICKLALFKVERSAGKLRRMAVVCDHDDGLAEFPMQLLKKAEQFLG